MYIPRRWSCVTFVERAPRGHVEEAQAQSAEQLARAHLRCVKRRVVEDVLYIVEYAVEGLE